ncbi:FtsX-like permease family protein [Verrucomicrobiales bacterium BCK34]|nr:FtsX-like permease family protein [Verrucomicrobiales bacterium BCK34]
MASITSNSRPSFSVGRLLWSRLLWRHWKQAPWSTFLLVAILAVGVAVFLSVRLASKAAVAGFGYFTESVAGESDFLLRPVAERFSDELLGPIRERLNESPVEIMPVLEISGSVEKEGLSLPVRLVGVDFAAMHNSRARVPSDQFIALMGRSEQVLVGAELANKLGLTAGNGLRLRLNDVDREVIVAGILTAERNQPPRPDGLLLIDLPELQKLADEQGALSRVEFRVPPGFMFDQNWKQVGASMWDFAADRGLVLETPEERKSTITQMSAAFRLNLAILSGLAMFVGIYLILQAMEASVIKRRSEIAILRSLGVTPAQIRATWLWEGALLGIIGTLIGIPLGRLVAEGLVGTLARTINTVYYETAVSSITLSFSEIAFCLVFGCSASVTAAWIPARDASTIPPAQALRSTGAGGTVSYQKNWLSGLLCSVIGIACTAFPPWTNAGTTRIPVGGYLAAIFLIVGGSLLIGNLFRPVALLLRTGQDNAMRSYAASQLMLAGARHRLTAAGLAVAVGMALSTSLLVVSFEQTLKTWINHTQDADITVSAPGSNSLFIESSLSHAVWSEIETLSGVDWVERLRHYTVTIGGHDLILAGIDSSRKSAHVPEQIWLDPPDSPSLTEFDRTAAEIRFPGWISETLSRRFHLKKGSEIPLPTPSGIRTVEVQGIFAEYGKEIGTLVVARGLLEEWFVDKRVTKLSIHVESAHSVNEILIQIRDQFPAISAVTSKQRQQESLRIFHDSFSVTYVLEAISILVAMTGLGLALVGLMLDRRNELSTLKMIGTTRQKIAAAAAWEGAGISFVGYLGGVILSLALGWILIFIINPQSFGWTLLYRLPWTTYFFLGFTTVTTGAIVSSIVGHRNSVFKSERKK